MIIRSLLDTDLYKFTMMQVVFHQFPSVEVEYRFKLRNPAVDLSCFADQIQTEINQLVKLTLNVEELNYLAALPYIKSDFIALLRNFKLNAHYVKISTEPSFELIVRGPWLQTILFEIPLLAIISEIYFRNTYPDVDYVEGKKRLAAKIDFIKNQKGADFKFSDFGTRRRFSRVWQEYVISQFCENLPQHFIGTSNVFYAKQFNLPVIGTMAHEFIQAFQALGPNVRDSQKAAFESWLREYRGQLGIALSDTFGLAPFLQDFDRYFAKCFEGIRQDSGDPFIWAEAIIEHYQKLGLDPKTKTLVFSDALTMEKAFAIYQQFHQKIKVLFGIGTHLTNDMGYPLLDMVIKMVRCNNLPVAKISDTAVKSISGDEQYLQYLKRMLGIK